MVEPSKRPKHYRIWGNKKFHNICHNFSRVIKAEENANL